MYIKARAGWPNKSPMQYVIPVEVVTNLTQDLEDLQADLERANTGFDRTLCVLIVCSVLSGLLLALDLYKMYRKHNTKKKLHTPRAERISDCEDNRV